MKKDPNFIYGKNPVLQALQSNKVIEKVVIQNTLRGELEKTVRKLCKEREIPLAKVPSERLDYLTYKQAHQGVAAYISPITFVELEDVISQSFAQGKNPSILILEGISDVRNFGAIARSAHVFGLDAIVFPMKHSARINEDAVKISAGALLEIPVCRERNMDAILDICVQNGLKIIGTDLRTDHKLEGSILGEPCAVIMGSEDRGITPESRKRTDVLVKIPQDNAFDSLNVSVAAGIICYEISKQRK